MKKQRPIEKAFWSVAFPGFGQLLNGKLIKGLFFVILEIIINVQANLNLVIVYSFQGEMDLAINHTNYQWLMFYPCVYMFAIWDAYRDAGGGNSRYSFLPFAFSAYFGTIGLIYSTNLKIFGVLPGPIFLPILFFFIGAAVGWLLKLAAMKFNKLSQSH